MSIAAFQASIFSELARHIVVGLACFLFPYWWFAAVLCSASEAGPFLLAVAFVPAQVFVYIRVMRHAKLRGRPWIGLTCLAASHFLTIAATYVLVFRMMFSWPQ